MQTSRTAGMDFLDESVCLGKDNQKMKLAARSLSPRQLVDRGNSLLGYPPQILTHRSSLQVT